MNYFIQNLEEEIKGLKSFSAAIDELCELAEDNDKVDQSGDPSLFKWTEHDILFNSYSDDDTLPILKWERWNDYNMTHYFTNGQNYYSLDVNINKGDTNLSFHKLYDRAVTDDVRSNCSQIVAVKQLAEDKAKFLEQKLTEMKTKYESKEFEKNALKTKLDTVRLVKNLMDDMGLSFDDNSKRTIINWEKEYKNL